MNEFIESLCRLYKAEKIDDIKLKELLLSGKINQQEYECITYADDEEVV